MQSPSAEPEPTSTQIELVMVAHLAAALMEWLNSLPASGGSLPFITGLQQDLTRLGTTIKSLLMDLDKSNAARLTAKEFARRFDHVKNGGRPFVSDCFYDEQTPL